MANMQRHYKQKGLGFGNVEEQRILRAGKHAESRKGRRAEDFAKNRNVSPLRETLKENTVVIKEEIKQEVVNDRLNMLQKWKAERDLRKKIEQVKKKPAFKVGVVHHSLCSPPLKNLDLMHIKGKVCKTLKPKQPTPPKRTTRATEKRLLAKATASGTFAIKAIKSKPKTPLPIAPENHKFKPPAGLPNIPLFGRVIPQNMTPTNGKRFLKDFTFMRSNSEEEEVDKAIIKQEFVTPDNSKIKPKEVVKLEKDSAEEDNNSVANSSIETVQLKVSSDEQESPSRSPKKSSNSSEDASTANTSLSRIPSLESAGSVEEPVFFSPYVVTSRGKSSARKEQKVKRGFSSSFDDIPTKDTVMQNLNISVEEEERTAQYFKFILNREIERLQELCDKWVEIRSQPDIPEDAQYLINQAIGQTQLLMRKKFERFRSLVADCETGKGQMLVTCKDLQGFWDMMYMEIKDCESRFEKMEKLQSNNWIEDQPTIQKPVAKKKAAQKKKVVPAKQSSIRALIMAARREKMIKKKDNPDEQTLDENKDDSEVIVSNNVPKDQSATKNNTRRSVSLNNSIQKCTPVKGDKGRHSLLRKVQLSETSKRLKSPIAIMKISQKCKTPEVQLDDSISYVNSAQTPGKSILKKLDEPVERETRSKTANKVNFDEHVVLNEVPIDEELQNKLDLQAALARIENYDPEAIESTVKIRAEKKLCFDDSSDESSNEKLTEETPNNIKEDIIPLINVEPPTPLNQLTVPVREKNLNRRSSKKIDNQSAVHKESSPVPTTEIVASTPHRERHEQHRDSGNDSEEESNLNEMTTRTLRNRTVTTLSTPKKTRRSVKVTTDAENEDKENKSSDKVKRRSSMKRVTRSEKEKPAESNDEQLVTVNNETNNRRKSTRKSVRFNAEDCTACSNIKPVHPMTPHARRSRARTDLSFLGEKETGNTSHAPDEDLISWDSPKKLPARVRRSYKR